MAQPRPQAEAFTGMSADDLRSAGAPRELRPFYEARGWRPLWVRGGAITPEAIRLLELFETANVDGLDSGDYRPRAIASAFDRADGGSPRALAKAELLLSKSFTAYVRDLRQAQRSETVYVDRELRPTAPAPSVALGAAAAAPSLRTYVETMGWMSPIYAQLRRALLVMDDDRADPGRERLLRLNLERARPLPAAFGRRHVVVDAAGARLWMIEDGRIRDTMRVIVGKPDQQTPVMAGLIRYVAVNPYWNMPPDLVPTRVAEGVLKTGPAHLRVKNFEVLSDWSDKPRVLSAASVDWPAVAAGRQELRVRQLPGRDNAMGKMKFMFPNELGIYLHDTPEKNLFKSADRRFSSGCVRVEDAPRLARWLFRKPLVVPAKGREKQVNLPEPVPVYISYLTAAPEGQGIVFRPDVYGRDLAALGRRSVASR